MATVATCSLCRNSFSDPIQTDFINTNPTGTCRGCSANLDNEMVPQQPNVGVAPIQDPLKMHQEKKPGQTGFEKPNAVTGSENQIPVTSNPGEEPFAVTPQHGNEAYNQGQKPTFNPDYTQGDTKTGFNQNDKTSESQPPAFGENTPNVNETTNPGNVNYNEPVKIEPVNEPYKGT